MGSYAGLGCAKEIVRGIQADLEYQMPEQDMVEVYLGKDIAPGFLHGSYPVENLHGRALVYLKETEFPANT